MDNKNIIELNNHKYKIELAKDKQFPCDLCDVRKECENLENKIEYNDYLMLCSCAFITTPYYVKKIE